MDLRKVLFLSRHGRHRPSVQIRCVEIARALGCDAAFHVRSVSDVPDGYSAFVCVKARFTPTERLELAKRGPIIWDVIDRMPPRESVSIHLASTESAKRYLSSYPRVEVIPHHHCNHTHVFNPTDYRRPAWVGHRRTWYPPLNDLEHDVHDVEGKSQSEVVEMYRRTGIGLNLRAAGGKKSDVHVQLNSGIKLINCIGFGIPSVSCDEPAYRELGEGCTLFAGVEDCKQAVQRLQTDEALYSELRKNCVEKAGQFDISIIAEKYRQLLESL